MFLGIFGSFGKIALLVAVLGVAAGTYAFTASNTVDPSKAGDGTGNITGYTITAIHYVLNSTNPANVDSFTFTTSSAPITGSTIKVKTPSGGSWITCGNSGTTVTCPSTGTLSSVTVVSLDTMQIVIAD